MNNDLSFHHLMAELGRIDAAIQRQVRRWQQAGQDPGDDFRGLYVSDAQANSLLERRFGSHWGSGVRMAAEAAKQMEAQESAARTQIEEIRRQAQKAGETLRLDRLCSVFGLDEFERDCLLICLCPALDLRYERLFGYLQDDVTRKRPGVNLILDLLCPDGPERLRQLERFADDAPLIQHSILALVGDARNDRTPLLSRALEVDETILHWLLNHEYHPGMGLLEQPQAQFGYTTPAQNALDELLAGASWGKLEKNSFERLRLVFHGPDHAARTAAARLLAGRRGSALLSLELQSAFEQQDAAEHLLRTALRDAKLTGALLAVEGWNTLLIDGKAPEALLRLLVEADCDFILAGEDAWLASGLEEPANLSWHEFPRPDYTRRMQLWRATLQRLPSNELPDLEILAGQFLLTGGQIRDAAAAALDWARERNAQLTEADLLAAARLHSNPRLSSLAHKIEPRYGWENIVLPSDQLALLQEMIATIRQRPQVLEGWGLGRKLVSSHGVTALFAGEPGTGKTMAAEVIANELGLDLYRIDLSTVISKYIGETEKNLERIFSEATNSNAILFFDEADALFGKRSEVRDSHDRYANIEISYLLQRMEAYDGVTILATNLRANLDEAFTRRLHFAVDFPFPDEAHRLRIWQTLFPEQVPCAADLDLAHLAERFKLAGGSIRNILVSAVYLAASDGGQVTMEHLLHGVRRELQKMGRLLLENDLGTRIKL